MIRFSFSLVSVVCFGLLWMTFGMVGCGGSLEPVNCTYNGKTYKTGDNFPSSDGCNVCICNEGNVACTTRACAPPSCGIRGGQPCAKGEFCNQPNHCGATDKPGECKVIPTDACATILAYVCGCDNKTYANECEAHKNGVSVQAQGKCPETGTSCDYNGKTYKHGDSYPSQDGCNTCTCNNGKTECKTDACPFKSCTYQGKEYKHGASFPASDGCNTCDCFDGKVTCTQNNCSSTCRYEGKEYKDGDSFPSTDGCNTCSCTKGQVVCTQKACPKPCTYEGKTYKDGDSFPATDGCNTCTCSNGQVGCTKINCPPGSCNYNGKTYKDGESFPATDGCNTCTCVNGQVGCTKIGCPSSCTYDGKTYKDGEKFPATDGCNTCYCSNGQVNCTKIACPPGACTSSKNCQATEYCEFKEGACGGTGTCKTTPTACTRDYTPVCGCDNKTYSNACNAYASGVSIKAQGECSSTHTCVYNGVTYKDGASFPATDGCNTCTCSNGVVGCTKIACPPKTCIYNGVTYKDGDTFPSTDGCNKCSCSNGTVTCTSIACPPKTCVYNGVTYKDGEKFAATDGCNTCYCSNGLVNCTKIACPPGACTSNKNCQATEYCEFKEGSCGGTGTCKTTPTACTRDYTPVCGCDSKTYSNACNAYASGVSIKAQGACPSTSTCVYNGVTYKDGASFPATDGCNTCTCSNGQVRCTLMPCPPKTCIYNGVTYKDGDTFPSTDGCNKCYCSNGTVTCTTMTCPPKTCTYNGITYKDGEKFPATDGCNTCHCSNGIVGCTKIGCTTACKTDSDCKTGEFCQRITEFCTAVGNCRTKPTACTQQIDYVCGCNNKTYSNSCMAYAAGVSIAYQGQCKCAGCASNKDCATTEYCAVSLGQCSGCGTCTTKPMACTQIYKPVCGCDHKTYGNSCSAASMGMNVLSDGACP